MFYDSNIEQWMYKKLLLLKQFNIIKKLNCFNNNKNEKILEHCQKILFLAEQILNLDEKSETYWDKKAILLNILDDIIEYQESKLQTSSEKESSEKEEVFTLLYYFAKNFVWNNSIYMYNVWSSIAKILDPKMLHLSDFAQNYVFWEEICAIQIVKILQLGFNCFIPISKNESLIKYVTYIFEFESLTENIEFLLSDYITNYPLDI
jgi:hypothetical protein